MTTANKIRLRRDMQIFKKVNHDQRRQASVDMRKYIKDMANDYNANRLPGEPLMVINEMVEHIGRKC